jgi:prokaryotic YEATS domain
VDNWIPFFQTLIWPVFVGALCYWLREEINSVLTALRKRIEAGDPVESPWLKLGKPEPKLPGTSVAAQSGTEGGTSYNEAVPHDVYLVHSARRDKRLDKNNKEYYRLQIWLDADSEDALRGVESVTYYLHPTFENPTRTVSDSESAFALATAAWGQFLLYAIVKLKDGKPPLKIERFIDF